MPPTQWPHPTGLIESIEDEFFRFDFFQAMWTLECALEAQGEQGPIIGEQVRFKNSLSLKFPPSQIENLVRTPDAEQGQYEVTPAFFGLTGLSGALPRPYTELLIEQEAVYRDDSARAFFDIFSNKMLTLFFEAWKKHKLNLLYQKDPKRYFLPHVLSFAGARSRAQDEGPAPAGSLAPESLAFYAATQTKAVVSVEDLEAMLNKHFQVPMRVSDFLPSWVNLKPEYQAALRGRSRLGHCFCGSRVKVWDKKLRISAGPLTKAQWHDFLPEGTARVALMELLAFTLGAGYQYELQLILRKEDIHPLHMSADNPIRLGMDSFLVSQPETQDRGDVCFAIKSLMNRDDG